jgi:thioredoxin 1
MKQFVTAAALMFVAVSTAGAATMTIDSMVDTGMKKTGDAMTEKKAMMGDGMMKKEAMMEKKDMMHDESFGMGARGAHVMALQEMLISKGLLAEGSAKGNFGPATKRALMKYQAMMGLKATGFAGPMTRAKWKMMKDDGMMMKKDAVMEKKDAMGDGMMKKDMMGDGMMKKDDSMMKKDMMMNHGTYEAYSAEKIAMAQAGKVVIFFHAPWCPVCVALDTDISAHTEMIPEGIHILKVDYDTATALRSQYGVATQYTFVQVDGLGAKKSLWNNAATLAQVLAKIQ